MKGLEVTEARGFDMDILRDDNISKRIGAIQSRKKSMLDQDFYFYNQPIKEIHSGARVILDGREMSMYASYSYLGLIGHPRINEAAKAAIDKFGTGTHGVRFLAGTLTIHDELESTIAAFTGTEAAVVFTSGYVTNITAISTLLGRGDYVLSDKLNHASIVDGCRMSGAKFQRFKHNDMADLEHHLQRLPQDATKLVVADAVFSMDGDVIDLPKIRELCQIYGAYLMLDEAHSVGVLGDTGRGIEEHFGLKNTVDIKMGTLSKTIPSVGGYIAGKEEMIDYLRHVSRGYMFSSSLPPAQVAAANEAFKVILDEPWRIEKLRQNTDLFIKGLKSAGFDTMSSTTAIVPVFCGTDERAFRLTRACQHRDLFVLPIVAPAVPEGQSRLRATVTAAHEPEDIERAVAIFAEAGKEAGIID